MIRRMTILCSILIWFSSMILPGFTHEVDGPRDAPADSKKRPTVVFYVAYIFEARTNGDTLEFPLLPGETAIGTLDQFSETAQGYLHQLRSIYSFNHFSLLTTLGGGFSIGLERGDGHSEELQLFGPRKHLFSFQAQCKTGTDNELLPIRIEAQLDTSTEEIHLLPSEDRIYLFKTLCTVKSGHPLVIGRPLNSDYGKRTAIFVVFTPFFHRLSDPGQYNKIVSDFKKVFQISVSHSDAKKRYLFEHINKYFASKLRKSTTLAYEKVISDPPPPPPPPEREDIPVFVPHDQHPEPVGGYVSIQRNLRYPEIARKAGTEGRVLVWAKINEKGEVIKMRIMTSLGPNGCDEAAMDAIGKTQWKPAMKDDQPITVWIAVPVEFRLR